MIQTRVKPMTAADLFARSDDDQKRFELVAGTLVEAPVVVLGRSRSEGNIHGHIWLYLREHPIGAVFTSDTQFVLSTGPDTVRMPDVAVILNDRLPDQRDWNRRFQGAPDLAVEIASPANSAADLDAKVRDYLTAGTRLVWVVRWREPAVTVYAPGLEPSQLGPDDALDGKDVLPGFRLPLRDINR